MAETLPQAGSTQNKASSMAAGLAGSFASSALSGMMGGMGGGAGGGLTNTSTATSRQDFLGDIGIGKRNVMEGSRDFVSSPIFGSNPFTSSAGISGINYNYLIFGAIGIFALVVYLKFK